MKTRYLLGITAGVIAVIAAAIVINVKLGPGVRATLATAATENLDPSVFGIGNIEARSAYSIGPAMVSRVATVFVDQGDTVVPGQLLAEMDPVDLDEKIESAKNALSRSTKLVDASAAQVAELQSRAKISSASAARFADLRKTGFVSADAADLKQHEANAAKASLDAAEAAHSAAMRDQARLGTELAGIQKQRAQYRLRSPITGVVQSRDAEPGSTLVAGQVLFRLLDPRTLWVRTRVDQARAGGLSVGQAATIVLRSQPLTPLTGTVARIDIASDPVTEERIVNIAISGTTKSLSPGELAEVTMQLPPVANALVIPTAAIRTQGGKTGVFRVQDGKAEFVAVKVGAQTLGGKTQILEGIASGDLVVHHVATDLRGGEQIRAVESLTK